METTEADRTAGRPVAAATLPEVAFPAGIPVTEVAVTIPMDQAAGGHRMADTETAEDPSLAAVVAQEVDGGSGGPGDPRGPHGPGGDGSDESDGGGRGGGHAHSSIAEVLSRLVSLQEQQARRGQRTDREKERERYRPKGKPSPIKAAQSENFIWQLLAFEEEMRDERRGNKEIWELFSEAVRDHPAGTHLFALKQSDTGRRFVQQLKACRGPERIEMVYGEMYRWVRSAISL